MKKMGRPHRPFFRVCAMNVKSPRDGKVIEELGYYDPMVRDADARAILDGERIAYWLGVGAQPSDKVAVLIKKYGPNGTHLEAQKAALERRKSFKPQAPAPYKPAPKPEPVAEAAPAAEGEAQAPAETAAE
jgi:small subunit ribosomal protein S16